MNPVIAWLIGILSVMSVARFVTVPYVEPGTRTAPIPVETRVVASSTPPDLSPHVPQKVVEPIAYKELSSAPVVVSSPVKLPPTPAIHHGSPSPSAGGGSSVTVSNPTVIPPITTSTTTVATTTSATTTPAATTTPPTIPTTTSTSTASTSLGYAPVSKTPRADAYVRINPYEIGGPDSPDNDYWSDSGQVAYEPDDSSGKDPGLARIQTFAYYDHVFAISPRLDYAGTKTPNPDQSTASLPVPKPHVVDIARNYGLTQNEALVLYDNGLLSYAGTQTSRSTDKGETNTPSIQFPLGKTPKAIAITSENEFALVALEDENAHRGEVAVVALEGKYIPYHTMPYMAFPNEGSWSDFKLLGYIDLPFDNPTAIAAATNGSWTGPSQTGNKDLGQIDITNDATRKLLYDGAWKNMIATKGYVVVASKSSGKASFIDLAPLLSYIRESYLSSSTTTLDTISARGAGESDFPKTFSVNSSNTPVVITTIPISSPSAVLAGIRLVNGSKEPYKAYIASSDGAVHIFSTQNLMTRSNNTNTSTTSVPVGVSELGMFSVGSDITDMSFTRFSETATLALTLSSAPLSPLNDLLYVVSRGQKEIDSVAVVGGTGNIYRRITDKRMTDPIAITVADRARILTVADYNGKKIESFRIGDLRSRDGQMVYPPGPLGAVITPGVNDYEFAGELTLPGKPFAVSVVNVN